MPSRPARVRLRLTRAALGWALGRALALVALLGATWLLYDAVTSPAFAVTEVAVTGTQLLSPAEVEFAAGVRGENLFLVRAEAVAEAVQQLPAVERAAVALVFPSRVEIAVSERVPYAVWRSGNQRWVVDRDGLVLGPATGSEPLLLVHDGDARPVEPGARVDRDALEAATRLRELLPPRLGWSPARYDYQAGVGVSIMGEPGLVVRFGSSADLPWKIETLAAILEHLRGKGATAKLIDVRFRDRPYFR